MPQGCGRSTSNLSESLHCITFTQRSVKVPLTQSQQLKCSELCWSRRLYSCLAYLPPEYGGMYLGHHASTCAACGQCVSAVVAIICHIPANSTKVPREWRESDLALSAGVISGECWTSAQPRKLCDIAHVCSQPILYLQHARCRQQCSDMCSVCAHLSLLG